MDSLTLEKLTESYVRLHGEKKVAERQFNELRQRRSFFANLRASIFGDDTSRALYNARYAYSDIIDSCTAHLALGVPARKLELLAADASEVHKYNALGDAARQAKRNYRAAERLFNAADDASKQVRAAIAQCDSAITTETLDMFTKSKAISVLSTLDTMDANSAITSANKALEHLKSVIRESGIEPGIPGVSDTLDLMVDLVMDLSIDILSWFNIVALENAVKAMKKVLEQLNALEGQLYVQRKATLDSYGVAKREYESFTRPYYDKAVSQVPEVIRNFVPKHYEDA